MKEKLSDKTIWILAGCALLGAVLLLILLSAQTSAAGRLVPPTATPALTPSPSPSASPTASPLPEGYRLPLVPVFASPAQTTPPTPASSSPPKSGSTPEPVAGVYSDHERTFLAAGFLRGEPVALFVIRQQAQKLTALSLCPQCPGTRGLAESMAALKAQVLEEAGIMVEEYVYMDFAALPALSKAAGAEEAFVAKGQEALSLSGEERARAMLLLGAELFDELKNLSPLNALLLQSTIQGQWGSSLKLSRLWPLGSAMKKCTERVLVLVPEGGTEEQKNILKNFFTTG